MLCLGCSIPIMKLMGLFFFFLRYVHHVLEVEKKSSDFIERIKQFLIQIFPKVMEMLESKRKRLQFPNTKGHVVKISPFTTIAFTKDYEVKIHENKDDDDICFILWLRKVFEHTSKFWFECCLQLFMH